MRQAARLYGQPKLRRPVLSGDASDFLLWLGRHPTSQKTIGNVFLPKISLRLLWHCPPTATDYSKAGLPWFDYYGGDKVALDGAKKLAGMQSVTAKSWQTGAGPLPGNEPATSQVVKTLGERQVRDSN